MQSFVLFLITLTSLTAFAQTGTDVHIKKIDPTKRYDLSGRDGRDGRDGRFCDSGEDGTDGTDGGDVYVNVNDLSDLADLYVISMPGRGGRGGRTGPGIESGCPRVNYLGEDGENGKTGVLHVIPAPFELIPRVSSSSETLKKYLETGLTLSENILVKNKGALKLLAPGSFMDDTYILLSKVSTKEISLKWNSDQELSLYENSKIVISLKNEKVSLSSYRWDELIIDYTVAETETKAVITINKIIKKTEVFKISDIKYSGHKESLKLQFTDNGVKDPKIKVQYKLELEGHSFNSINTILYGFEATPFVSTNGSIVTLDIGALPIHKGYLKRGKNLTVKLDLIYIANNQEFEEKVEIDFKVGRN